MRGLLLLLAGCGGVLPTSVDAVGFLEGCWSRGDLQECWVRDGERMNGLGRHEGRVTETLVIEPQSGGLVYLATPAGQDTVPFALVEVSASVVRFENPAHDFPKWIRYELDGDTLTGTIGDAADPAATFRLVRERAESP